MLSNISTQIFDIVKPTNSVECFSQSYITSRLIKMHKDIFSTGFEKEVNGEIGLIIKLLIPLHSS